MIEEFLTWLQLINQQGLLSLAPTSQNLSNLIFLGYLISIRKSYLFGVAFLLCETLSFIDLIPSSLPPPIYGLTFYCAILLTWIAVAGLHIRQTTNKNTLMCCVIMILFLLFMAWDSYINAYIETVAWRYYENIIVLIHAAIIVSLYRDKFIFDRLVDELVRTCSIMRVNVYLVYFWYTVKKINQGK
tara:strand:- start:33844 stop:34404 length:561 start_codon:yes stop_codon:yes gene_type:complete